MRRYLCLYLPNWPVQWLRQVRPETVGMAAGIFERLAHGPVLAHCSMEARKLGALPGMSVADARALVPGLMLYEVDRAADRRGLEELCVWAGRFSPLAGVEPECCAAPHPESLLLDIAGCEQVFRGEENLLRQALAGLRRKGLEARAAIGGTIGAAWGVAHYGVVVRAGSVQDCIVGQAGSPHHNGRLEACTTMHALPVAALRLEIEALAHLDSLGIACVGELIQQPRATLPSRFGAELIARIDQAFGDAVEVLTPLRPAPEFRAARAFDYPLRSSEHLYGVVEELTGRLAGELQAAERGAREIECWLYHELAQPVCVAARLFKGSARAKHLWRLLHVKLEDSFRKPHAVLLREQRAASGAEIPVCHGRQAGMSAPPRIVVDAEEGFCAVVLQVLSSEKMGNGQLPLFDAGAAEDVSENVASLVDRLASRLGAGAVLRVREVESAIPEGAYRGEAFGLAGSPHHKDGGLRHNDERPLRMLGLPVLLGEFPSPRAGVPASAHFRGERGMRLVTGPERIESGWWGETPARRDYYVAEGESGARYWVFRELEDGRWFLHGTFE